MYEVECKLKNRMRAAGLTTRELAHALKQPPGTVSGRLNGFLPLTIAQREIIERTIKEAENKQNEIV